MQLAALLAFVPNLPFFQNATLAVRRGAVSYDDDGLAQSASQAVPFTGSVDPSQSETLNRMLEGESLSGAIMVHTAYRLSAGGEDVAGDVAADLIEWNGRTYQVRAVSDWAEGGAGLISAACTLVDLNPPAV